MKNNLFDNHNFYKRRNSDIEQENEKSPDINLTFLPFPLFPNIQTEIEQKTNINCGEY